MRVRNRKTLIGIVHSDKMDKTITINVERRYKHAKYGKYVVSTKRYSAHDETNDARVGDEVEVVETRRLSKSKRWRLLRVIERAPSREDA